MVDNKRLFTPSGIADALIELAAAVLLITVVLGIVVWVLSRIWLWLLGLSLIAGGIWLATWIIRWRRDQW